MAVCLAAVVAPHLSAAVDTGQTRLFRYLMGTSVKVEVYGGDAALRQQAADEAFAAIAEVDRLMSDYRSDSELTMVNRAAAARAVPVSDPLFAVLDAAERVAQHSDGAFDITARPLAALWSLDDHRTHAPASTELAAIRPLVGYRQVVLDRQAHTVRFARAGVQIDLGGMAKGFAAEVAAGSLTRRGLSGVVDVGGTQYMVGRPIGKRAWSVGIGHPERPGTLLGSVDIEGGAMSTCKQVLDPRTLGPSTASLSATVVSRDGTISEALARAAFVLGPKDGLALLDDFPDTWGVVAYRQPDGTIATAVSSAQRRVFHPSTAY